jgi:hypothetical protein
VGVWTGRLKIPSAPSERPNQPRRVPVKFWFESSISMTKLFEGYDFRTCYEVECERERERERERKREAEGYGLWEAILIKHQPFLVPHR